MHEWQQALTLLAGVPIALLTSWFTVTLALRRFQSEKWFERRVAAYIEVIECLHYMKHCTRRQLRAATRGIDIPTNAEDELIASYSRGLADLRRLIDMGALLFSAEAVTVLDRLTGDLGAATEEQTWWDHLDAESAAIANCLAELRGIAKRDLNA